MRQQQALWVWQNFMTETSPSQPLAPIQGNWLVLEGVWDTTCLQRVTPKDTAHCQSCCASCPKMLYLPRPEPQHGNRRTEEALVLLLSNSNINDSIMAISHNSVAQKFPTIGNRNAFWKHLRVTTHLSNPNKSNTRGEFGLFQMLSKIFIAKMLSVIPFQFF